MTTMNLQDSFKKFCEQNKFDLNDQQVEIINLLEKVLKLWSNSF